MPELLLAEVSTGIIWAQRTASSESPSLSAVLVHIFSFSFYNQRHQLSLAQTGLWVAFPSASSELTHICHFLCITSASSPSQACSSLSNPPNTWGLSTRTQASNVSLPFQGTPMLSTTERHQHILAARAVQVSPVRAHIPAPTHTHTHPTTPSPLNTLCSPQSCQSLAQGQLPSSQVYLSLPQLFLFSKALIIIYLPDKILPVPPGMVNLTKLMCHCLLGSKSYSVWH